MNEELPLRDVHAAAAPPWWPPAPGWWLVAMLVVLASVWLAWRGWLRWQRHRRRAELLEELSTAARADDDLAFLRAMADFCKRLLLHEAGRRDVAAGTGATLVAALVEPWPDNEMHRKAARSLALDAYRPGGVTAPREAITDLAAAWIDRIVLGARR